MPSISDRSSFKLTMARREVLFCLLAAAVLLLLAFLWKDCFIDDAFIGFRYIDNALEGRGLVFNPPDRVEGVSNIGWLLVLMPFAFIIPVTAAAKVLSLLLVFAAMVLLIQFVSRSLAKDGDRMVPCLLPLLLAANLDFTYFSLAGLETPLAAFGLSLMLVLSRRPRALPALAILGSFLFLVRPECVLLFPLFLFINSGARMSRWTSSSSAILIFILLLALFTLTRYAYYGSLLPNTFTAKSASWAAVVANALSFLKGANVNIPFPFPGWLALPAWLNGLRLALRSDRKTGSFLAGALATGLLFGLYAGPDWTEMGRYFAPYIPIAMFIFLIGLADLLRALVSLLMKSEKAAPLVTGLAGAALIMSGAAGIIFFLEPTRIEAYPGYVLTSVSLVEPSLWMRDHLPENAVIATGRIGALSYYSKKKIFDYKFGLTEPAVARMRRRAPERFADPRDPALAELWAKTDPGYFLDDLQRIRIDFHLGPGKIETLMIHGRNYRLLKTFPLGYDADWALYERVDRPSGLDPAKLM